MYAARPNPAPRAPRVGIGHDVHRLVEGRPLILGGVSIPHERGLEGHSDGDALCHAVTDAVARVLGDEKAAGLDDVRSYEAFAEQVKETKRRLLEFLARVTTQHRLAVLAVLVALFLGPVLDDLPEAILAALSTAGHAPARVYLMPSTPAADAAGAIPYPTPATPTSSASRPSPATPVRG